METVRSNISFNLVNKTDSAKYVVESYVNGKSWYRIWSDGFCEQGGQFRSVAGANQVLTFLKPFKDTNYTVFGTNQQTVDAGICGIAFTAFTNSQCRYCTGYNGTFYSEDFYWFATGYIEQN